MSQLLSLQVEKPRRLSISDLKELGVLSVNGSIRLEPAQRWFENNEKYSILPDVFELWRDHDEYLVFRHIEDGKSLILGLKASKRGNDVYVRRIEKRFSFLRNHENSHAFFRMTDLEKGKDVRTPLLWTTLTWNPRLCSSRKRAWQTEIGKEFNRFISAIRSKYGKVDVLRSWESSKAGYPHVHALLWFQESTFSVFSQYSEKARRFLYRVKEKDEIASHWSAFVDIQALNSMKQAMNYVLKYQLKVHEGSNVPGGSTKTSKTLPFMWLFRKRGFSCSRGFRKRFEELHQHDLIETLHNSNFFASGLSPRFGEIDRVKGGHGKFGEVGCVENLHEGKERVSNLECSDEETHSDREGTSKVVGASGRFSLSPNVIEEESSDRWEFLGILSGSVLGLHGERLAELREDQVESLIHHEDFWIEHGKVVEESDWS